MFQYGMFNDRRDFSTYLNFGKMCSVIFFCFVLFQCGRCSLVELKETGGTDSPYFLPYNLIMLIRRVRY